MILQNCLTRWHLHHDILQVILWYTTFSTKHMTLLFIFMFQFWYKFKLLMLEETKDLSLTLKEGAMVLMNSSLVCQPRACLSIVCLSTPTPPSLSPTIKIHPRSCVTLTSMCEPQTYGRPHGIVRSKTISSQVRSIASHARYLNIKLQKSSCCFCLEHSL